MKLPFKSVGFIIGATLWVVSTVAIPQGAHAQTHLFPETDVVNVTSYTGTWQATPVVTGSSLNITFQNDANTYGPAIWMNASSADWTGAQAFVVALSNLSPDSISLTFQIFDAPGDSGPSVGAAVSLDRGESTIMSANLNSNSYNTYGMGIAPPLVIGSGVTSTWSHWPSGFGINHIDHIKISASYTGAGSPTINLRSMRISKPSTEVAMYTGLMDQFGQYAQGNWLNKITSTPDLAARLTAENADLAAHPVSADWDSYGGWATGPTITSATSGFFSTAQYNGKWWLVTPGGHLFWYTSFTDINPSYFAVGLAGRQYMMASQPQGGPYGAYDFFAGNVNQKYAGNPAADGSGPWRTQMIKRLKSWGMNSIGEFSDGGLANLHQAPYAIYLDITLASGNYVPVSDGVDGGSVYDPFVDGFAANIASVLAPQFNPATVNDPWCMGYFGPGEVGWGAGWGSYFGTYMARYGLAVTVLNNPPTYSSAGTTNCAKQQFVTDLNAEYGTIDSLNAAWNTSFGSWSALLSATNWVTTSPTTPNAAMTADLGAFITHLASAHFQVVHQTIKANDPNHLDLGPHFGCPTPEIVAGAKDWTDVITYDPAGGGPALFNPSMYETLAIANSSNKPWIVGSWVIGTTDCGMFSGWGENAKNRQDCGNLYQKFVNILLSSPVFVGSEFYRFSDESLIGDTGGFKENLQEGFVDMCDTPYYPMINAARAVHATMYRQHGYTGSPRNTDSNGISSAIVPGLVEAETCDTGSNGVACKTTPSTEACSDTGGGLDITGISAGDFWSYTINAVPAGQYTVGLRVAASSTGAWLHIEDINGVNLSGPIPIPATGSGQTWETVNATVSLTGGSQTIRVVADNAGFNFNNLSFYWMPYEGDYTIMNVNSSMFMAPPSGQLTQAMPDNAADQRWHLTPTGDGYYTFSSFDRTQNICVASGSTGAAVVESTASPAWNQQWQLVPSGFAGYQLVNRSNGLALDVSGSSTTAGTGLVQQTVSSGTSQVWIFAYVPGVAYMPVPQAVANPYAPPAAPTGLTATGSNGAVTLGWTVASGTGCNVKRSLTSGSGYVTIATGVATSFYTDNSVTNGTAYYYVVSAVNAFSEGPNSTEAGIMPAVPPVLTVTYGNGSVTLNWTATPGATSYNVLRSLTVGGVYTTIASGVTGNTYVDNSGSGGTVYYYKVSAENSGVAGPDSSTVGISIPVRWTNGSGGSWQTGGNWAGGVIPGGIDATADFSTLNLTADATVTLDGAMTIGNLIFGDTTPSNNWFLNTGSAGSLTLRVSSGSPVITVNNRTATIGATLAGSQGLLKSGSGTLVLSGTSNLGNTTLGSGVLDVIGLIYDPINWQGWQVVTVGAGSTLRLHGWAYSSDNLGSLSAGAGNVVIDGGTIELAASNNYWENRGFTIGAGGATLLADAGVTFNIGNAFVTSVADNSSLTLDGSGSGAIYLPVTGSGSLIKNGSGIWTLSGSNSYTGSTTVNSGTLCVNGTISSTAALTVASGATLSGTGTIAGAVTVGSGGIVAPGDGNGNAGPLTLSGTLAPSGGSTLNFVLGSSASDSIQITGAYSAPGGTVSINLSSNQGGLSAGTYSLITGAAGISAGSFAVGSAPTGYGYALSASNGTLSLTVTAPATQPTGLTATGGNGSVSLGWAAASGAVSYNVKRSPTSGGGYVTIASGVTATTYIDYSVSNGTTYYYVVSSVNGAGESTNSTQAGAMPVNQVALPSPWTKVDVGSVGTTGTSYYDGGSTFVVKGAGRGLRTTADSLQFAYVTTTLTSFSVVARVTTSPTGSSQVGVMMRSGTSAGATMVAVMLDPNAGSYRARLGYRTTTGGSMAWASAASTGLAIPQWLKLTRAGNLYTGQVSSDGQTWTTVSSTTSAIIGNGSTAYAGLAVSSLSTSSLVTETFDNVSLPAWTAPPGAPSGLTAAAASQTQINLSWSDASGATGYQVLRSSSWGGTYTQIGTSATASYSDTGLSAGSAWYYMVRATSSSGTSGNSTVATATTLAAVPAGFTATAANGQVGLSWSASGGSTGYNVKRSTVSGSNYVTIVNNTAATSYTDTGVTNWTTYYYVVSALDAGGESANSAQSAAQPQSPAISAAEKNASSSISLSGSTGTLTFKSSVIGHNYQLQYIDSLTSGTWTNYGTAQPGTGGILIFPAPYDNTVPRRFYRLQIRQ
jgi:autotransporter-associated beta strand protein